MTLEEYKVLVEATRKASTLQAMSLLKKGSDKWAPSKEYRKSKQKKAVIESMFSNNNRPLNNTYLLTKEEN